MIIKTTFKSHFKVKKNFKKNKSKFIFVKNIVVLFLFFRIFLKNCQLNLLFSKKKSNKINILKAPSRHKKFFHQTCLESFILKSSLRFFIKSKTDYKHTITFFKNLNLIFEKFGSNTLNKTRFSARFFVGFGRFFCLR